jgi:hypothetical protein
MIRTLRKLRARSFAELGERAAQRLTAALEARGLTSTVHELSDDALTALLDPTVVAGGSGQQRLAHFRARATPLFFEGIRDGTSAAELRRTRWSNERARLIAAAERVLAGSYDLLGHTGLSFGSPVDWHLDPTTGRRSPRVHWSRIPYLDTRVVGDHKVVWEINRHQHFVVLGRAFQVTQDHRFAQGFAAQIASWMDDNPPKEGVNWASSLEVAYRAISWLWALELFRDAPELDAPLLSRMLKYLHVHGRHLERYLSTYFSPNTHLTGEALGLLYLGTMLPELRPAERWRTLGWSILERELFKQVHPDGVYFEQATYYHRYTLDIYLHALVLTRANGRAVPAAMAGRLALAAEHLADLTRPDGTIPMIGDDDGGRLVALEQRAPADVRAALGTAAVVLERPALARVAGGPTEEVLWLLGPAAAGTVCDEAAGAAPPHTSRLFATGGYVVMRDGWGPHANHAVIDCGPLGIMNCGHAHSDALSIEITAQGHPVVVDAGTYTYTGSATARDHFRHSAAHNTVTVDGEGASVTAGPFSWRSRADARTERWWPGELVDDFVGSHPGFARLPDPAVHRRRVTFVRDGYWVIVDTIDANGPHEVAAQLQLAADARVTATAPAHARIEVGPAERPVRVLLYVGGDAPSFEWGEDWLSPAYGSRLRAPHARATSRGAGRHDIITVVLPVTGAEPYAIHGVSCDGGLAVRVERGDTHDTLLFRRHGIVRGDSIEMDADAALIRRSGSTGEVLDVALVGSEARLRAGSLTFHAATTAEFRRTDVGWKVRGGGTVEATPGRGGR